MLNSTTDWLNSKIVYIYIRLNSFHITQFYFRIYLTTIDDIRKVYNQILFPYFKSQKSNNKENPIQFSRQIGHENYIADVVITPQC